MRTSHAQDFPRVFSNITENRSQLYLNVAICYTPGIALQVPRKSSADQAWFCVAVRARDTVLAGALLVLSEERIKTARQVPCTQTLYLFQSA